MCFPVNFAKFLRKPFNIEHLRLTASAFLNSNHLNPFLSTDLSMPPKKTYGFLIISEGIERDRKHEMDTVTKIWFAFTVL